ncbi:MAG: hypothetical protein CML24_05940 [Rhizobiales bacterium]|nr:hypothetical protein [Hyphomicrobiales bacterium]
MAGREKSPFTRWTACRFDPDLRCVYWIPAQGRDDSRGNRGKFFKFPIVIPGEDPAPGWIPGTRPEMTCEVFGGRRVEDRWRGRRVKGRAGSIPTCAECTGSRLKAGMTAEKIG